MTLSPGPAGRDGRHQISRPSADVSSARSLTGAGIICGFGRRGDHLPALAGAGISAFAWMEKSAASITAEPIMVATEIR
jgi:hypothetical protein